ncbi:hypothetical protein [Hyphobacterium sp.]|uniref:hypothetical protein n=1 Tax=Hyphobacterium sp. TaxID=2004662 RepID=UPI003B516B2D
MTATSVLVLHAPDDAKDAYRMVAALSATAPIGRDVDVRPAAALDSEASPDTRGATHIVLIASEAAIASLAVSQFLHAFLETSDRAHVFPVVSSAAGQDAHANAFISPLLQYKRASDDSLLESVTSPVRIAGDLRTETASAIAGRLAPEFADPQRPRFGLAAARRIAARPGTGWGVAASLVVISGLFGIAALDRGQRLQEADLAAHQARVETTRLLAELEDTLSPDARREVFNRVGDAVISLADAGASQASDADISSFARMLHVVGDARRRSNDVEGALVAFNAAARMTGQLLAARPEDPQRVFDHAQSVFWIGDLGFVSGRYDIAAEQYAAYERLAAQLIEIDPDNPVYRGEWAYAQINSGIIDLEFDNWDAALVRFDRAAELFEDGLIELGVVADDDLANAHGWAASPLRALGRLSEATERRAREVAVLEQSLAGNSDSRSLRDRLVGARTALAILHMDLGDLDAAETEIERAGDLARELVAAWPDNRSILRHHLTLERQRARLALWRGDLRTAQLINTQARRDFASSTSAEIDDHRYVDAAYFDLLAADVAMAAGAHDAALSAAASALVNFERDISSTGSRLRHFAAASLLVQGQAFDALGRRGDAERAWRAGLAHVEAMPEPRDLRAEDYRSRLLWWLGRREEAEALYSVIAASEYHRPDFEAFWAAPPVAIETVSATGDEAEDG